MSDTLEEAAQKLSDFLFDGIGWIEHGPSGMSVADAERLMQLGDALRAAIAEHAQREEDRELAEKDFRERMWSA